ncbi:MAG: heterodisulfide reductase-related iron-sulfur binding cluster [Nanoarchaeota archaeon]
MGLFNSFISQKPLFLGDFSDLEISEKYKSLLKRLNIEFNQIQEIDVGISLFFDGNDLQLRKLARENYRLLKENKIKKIIVSNPYIFYLLKFEYPKYILDWDLEIEYILFPILEGLKKMKFGLKELQKERICYHDPCFIGRYSSVYEEPREIIKLLGCELIEMKHNKENALCCGACACYDKYNPSTSRIIAQNRIKEIPANCILVVPCISCYNHLKKSSDKIEEMSEFILRKLKSLNAK